MRLLKHFPILAALTLAHLYPVPAGAAPSLTALINSVDATAFPTTVAYLTVSDEKGGPVLGLRPSDFQVLEDGTPAQAVELTTGVNAQEALSAVLTIDVSGSMDGGALEAEKLAAAAFIQTLRPQDR